MTTLTIEQVEASVRDTTPTHERMGDLGTMLADIEQKLHSIGVQVRQFADDLAKSDEIIGLACEIGYCDEVHGTTDSELFELVRQLRHLLKRTRLLYLDGDKLVNRLAKSPE